MILRQGRKGVLQAALARKRKKVGLDLLCGVARGAWSDFERKSKAHAQDFCRLGATRESAIGDITVVTNEIENRPKGDPLTQTRKRGSGFGTNG